MIALLLFAAQTAQPLTPPPARATRAPGSASVLFLNFDGASLHGDPGCNDATANCSFILAQPLATFPAFGGTAAQKEQIIFLVRGYYADFNVDIVLVRPATGPYSMTMVGGTPQSIGLGAGAAGVAPLDCGNISALDLSFAFADVLGSDPQETATTIAQESAHGYGLSHVEDMGDVMYPMVNRYANGFQNKTMHIFDLGGNSDCDGTGFQNSHARLETNVGAAPPDMAPPTIALTAPASGATLPSGFTVSFDVADNRALANVDLIVNGMHYDTKNLPPWTWDVPGGTFAAGPLRLSGTAHDRAGNQATTPEITVTVKKLGDTPGDLGTSCQADGECTGVGALCANHQCTRLCTSSMPCPSGFSCEQTQDFTRQCRPAPSDSGCQALPGRADGAAFMLILLMIIAMVDRHRRYLLRMRFGPGR